MKGKLIHLIAVIALLFSFASNAQSKHPAEKKKTKRMIKKIDQNKKFTKVTDTVWKKDADLANWEPI